jgi:hypothetical protein
MAQDAKKQMLETLRKLVREALRLRREGAMYARLSRAGGAVDGYMNALVDAGLASRGELLELLAAERAAHDGPATGAARPELDSILAA